MARRSSARLRGRNSSTPKRVSLSHDAQPQTPRTAPVKLASLNESDEMPGAFPSSASPPPRLAVTGVKQRTVEAPLNFNSATPTNATPIKPTEEEMHPKQHQQSTAKPLEEARWLGFSNMKPQTEPPKQINKLANLQDTPTKATSGVGSSKVSFGFNREQSLELSPAAKRIMEETREEAAKIREQMVASGEAAQGGAEMAMRKIATPKSRKGRFSDVHKAEFNKMDSIASHHSVRHWPLNISVATPGQKSSQKAVPEESPMKSLKRKQSRADLDEPDRYPQHDSAAHKTRQPVPAVDSQLPRPTSTNNPFSPTKRLKSGAGDYTRRLHSQMSTPQRSIGQLNYPDLSNLASPTQASLARTPSLKETSKIPGPALVRSPSKPALRQQTVDSPRSPTPLLARSPSKAALFERAPTEAAKTSTASPLLLRSPTKPTTSKKATICDSEEPRSPDKEAPLLARSPLKISTVKNVESSSNDNSTQANQSSNTPLLHRSPTKVPSLLSKTDGTTPTKMFENGILGRFQLLRSSPMKSILRSPQRLYSNDPAKVAAGTHLDTPPKLTAETKQSGSVQKRVDFTSSTKARYERVQSELSSTPSRGVASPSPGKQPQNAMPSVATFAPYPTIPVGDNDVVVTPQKRCQTVVPGDFTFKAGEHSITFRQSPNAPVSAAGSKRRSTIRHVSAEPILTQAAGQKRKLDFSKGISDVDEEKAGLGGSDKENQEEESERPAKRLKKATTPELPSVPSSKPVAKHAPVKRPTLGVKPKKSEAGPKEKKPSMISKARLAALSQPKRRT